MDFTVTRHTTLGSKSSMCEYRSKATDWTHLTHQSYGQFDVTMSSINNQLLCTNIPPFCHTYLFRCNAKQIQIFVCIVFLKREAVGFNSHYKPGVYVLLGKLLRSTNNKKAIKHGNCRVLGCRVTFGVVYFYSVSSQAKIRISSRLDRIVVRVETSNITQVMGIIDVTVRVMNRLISQEIPSYYH